MNEEIKEHEFKSMNLTAENKVLKADLLNGDSNLLEIREELRKMTETKISLD